MRKVAVWSLTLICLVATTSAQGVESCRNFDRPVMSKGGKVIWLTHTQLKKQVIKEVAGVVPGVGCIWRDTLVVVDVIVTEAGVVECAAVKSKQGHPLVKAGAVNTAKKWLFKPFLENGQPVAVSGKLEIFFAQNSGLSSAKKSILRIE
jgi:hypothetical protein